MNLLRCLLFKNEKVISFMENFENRIKEDQSDSKNVYLYGISNQKQIEAGSGTYTEILKIFKEAFSIVDINRIIKKL